MKHSILAAAVALLLAVPSASAVLAADGPVATGAAAATKAPAPTDVPPTMPAPTPTPPDGNGELVVDPTFIIATPDPTPVGEVLGVTARPVRTPPPTDSLPTAIASGTGLQVLSVLGVVGTLVALAMARRPVVRRR